MKFKIIIWIMSMILLINTVNALSVILYEHNATPNHFLSANSVFGIAQTIAIDIPGKTEINIINFTNLDLLNASVNKGIGYFGGFFNESGNGTKYASWELLKVNITGSEVTICKTPNGTSGKIITGNDIGNFIIQTCTLENHSILNNENMKLKLYIYNDATGIRSISHRWDNATYLSGLLIPLTTATISLDKTDYREEENVVLQIQDDGHNDIYTVNFYNNTGSVYPGCSFSGTSPSTPNQAFFESCILPLNSKGNDSYVIYNNTDAGITKKEYFNISEVGKTTLKIKSITFKNTGAYLGKDFAVFAIVTDYLDNPLIGSECTIQVHDTDETPLENIDVIESFADGTIDANWYLNPDIYSVRQYKFRIHCVCQNNTCIRTNNATKLDNIAFETANSFFEVKPYMSIINFTTSTSTVYTSGSLDFNLILNNTFFKEFNAMSDWYIQCPNQIEFIGQLEENFVDNAIMTRSKTEIVPFMNSETGCKWKAVVYPEDNSKIIHSFFSNTFDIINLKEIINITLIRNETYLFDNFPINITLFNPINSNLEKDISYKLEFYDFEDGEVYYFKGWSLIPFGSRTETIYIPFSKSELMVGKEKTGWIEENGWNFLSKLQQGDRQIKVYLEYEINGDTYTVNFNTINMKKPGTIHATYLTNESGSRTPIYNFNIDEFTGKTIFYIYYNITVTEGADGTKNCYPRYGWLNKINDAKKIETQTNNICFKSNSTSYQEYWIEIETEIDSGQYNLDIQGLYAFNPYKYSVFTVSGEYKSFERRQTEAWERIVEIYNQTLFNMTRNQANLVIATLDNKPINYSLIYNELVNATAENKPIDYSNIYLAINSTLGSLKPINYSSFWDQMITATTNNAPIDYTSLYQGIVEATQNNTPIDYSSYWTSLIGAVNENFTVTITNNITNLVNVTVTVNVTAIFNYNITINNSVVNNINTSLTTLYNVTNDIINNFNPNNIINNTIYNNISNIIDNIINLTNNFNPNNNINITNNIENLYNLTNDITFSPLNNITNNIENLYNLTNNFNPTNINNITNIINNLNNITNTFSPTNVINNTIWNNISNSINNLYNITNNIDINNSILNQINTTLNNINNITNNFNPTNLINNSINLSNVINNLNNISINLNNTISNNVTNIVNITNIQTVNITATSGGAINYTSLFDQLVNATRENQPINYLQIYNDINKSIGFNKPYNYTSFMNDLVNNVANNKPINYTLLYENLETAIQNNEPIDYSTYLNAIANAQQEIEDYYENLVDQFSVDIDAPLGIQQGKELLVIAKVEDWEGFAMSSNDVRFTVKDGKGNVLFQNQGNSGGVGIYEISYKIPINTLPGYYYVQVRVGDGSNYANALHTFKIIEKGKTVEELGFKIQKTLQDFVEWVKNIWDNLWNGNK